MLVGFLVAVSLVGAVRGSALADGLLREAQGYEQSSEGAALWRDEEGCEYTNPHEWTGHKSSREPPPTYETFARRCGPGGRPYKLLAGLKPGANPSETSILMQLGDTTKAEFDDPRTWNQDRADAYIDERFMTGETFYFRAFHNAIHLVLEAMSCTDKDGCHAFTTAYGVEATTLPGWDDMLVQTRVLDYSMPELLFASWMLRTDGVVGQNNAGLPDLVVFRANYERVAWASPLFPVTREKMEELVDLIRRHRANPGRYHLHSKHQLCPEEAITEDGACLKGFEPLNYFLAPEVKTLGKVDTRKPTMGLIDAEQGRQMYRAWRDRDGHNCVTWGIEIFQTLMADKGVTLTCSMDPNILSICTIRGLTEFL